VPAQPLPPDIVEIAQTVVGNAERLVPDRVRTGADRIVADWALLLSRAWAGQTGEDEGNLRAGLHGPQPIIVAFPDGTFALAVDGEGRLATADGPVPVRLTPGEMRDLGMEAMIPPPPGE
jgi:hypothetical protein